PHVDPEGQESAQMKAMRQLVRGIQPVPVVQQWHCAMCNTDYSGAKHCLKCNTGVYSTEVNQPR
ncbi:putative zinc ribbon protein, partial [Salmonella enterica]